MTLDRSPIITGLEETLRRQSVELTTPRAGECLMCFVARTVDELGCDTTLAAVLGQVTVLVDSRNQTASRATVNWLGAHGRAISTAILMGEVKVIRPRMEAQLERRL